MQCLSCSEEIPASSRFCLSCGKPVESFSQMPTNMASSAAAPQLARRISSSSVPVGGFAPGTILSDRYRMIALLGRGGMGEVYRADDLKLGQPVALKFLPSDVEDDPARLERFLSEVRTALRVTHPHVCRVFDIGQFENRYFLTMEYVDGEDLASLLRRIGRLPEDKAIEIARQLCAGLTAAHEEGVLHRDLKPANIMIDGRGRAKIADFGLAGATRGITGLEARAGTPQYMAPEQAAGGSLSERTDIYALGLVLYELFTGKRAFDVGGIDDPHHAPSSIPTNPSSLVSGLNPLVERAILRCLETDPARRPASASTLAAALPGGDPLAMAIAAGDTPSPEMVAAAGSDALLRPAIAWPLLGTAIIGVAAAAFLGRYVIVQRIAAPVKPPDVLIERARDIIKAASGTESGADAQDSAWGLEPDVEYLDYREATPRIDAADDFGPRGMRFWYRESPVPLERMFFAIVINPQVSPSDPAMLYSGETRVWLDRDGRLLEFTAVPPQRTDSELPADTDWSALFRAAGFDADGWVPSAPQWSPAFFADRQVAWVPRERSATAAVRVEAGSFDGRPVAFHVIFPWTTPLHSTTTQSPGPTRAANLGLVVVLFAAMVLSAVVAWRNTRLDRADVRGANRLAAVAMVLLFVVWLIDEHHVASIWEMYLFAMGAARAVFTAAVLATFYLALEPYVRRTWPSTIVSWSRLVAGNIRDPLVARDVLLGCAAGGVLSALLFVQ